MALQRKAHSNGQRSQSAEVAPPARPSLNDDTINAELRAWGHHLELMVEVSSVLTADPGREAIHEQILSGLCGSHGLVRAVIYQLHPDEGILRSVTEAGAAGPEEQHALPLDGPGLVPLAARRKEAIHVSDVTAAPPGLCANPETRSEYAVPLMMGQRLLGVLSIASPETDGIRAATRNLADHIAGQVAFALERNLLFGQLRESESRFRSIFERGDVSIGLINSQGTILSVNRAFARLVGCEPEGVSGRLFLDFILDEDAGPAGEWLKHSQEGAPQPLMLECRLLHESGAVVWSMVTVSLLGDTSGHPSDILVVAHNLQERKRAEAERERMQEQLSRGQKMKALGTLAGGIAHDFNNLLGVISGYISLLKIRLPREDPLQQVVATMQVSAGRAAELTQQLLHFSRQQAPRLQSLDLAESLNNVLKIVTQTFDRRIRIESHFPPRLPQVLGDAGQLELALLNLCINARDAMPEGGTLTMDASVVNLTAGEIPAHAAGPAGEYVRIVVRDTGKGMNAEVMDRIFEPFFTTKEESKGAGLGLALVYGAVAHHLGFIGVRSQIGRGSEFTVHFPVARPPVDSPSVKPHDKVKRGRGTVLVVDDEPLMVDFSCEAVRELGYSALSATDGAQAPLICAQKAPPVDAVLLDMVMPGPSWEATIKAIRAVKPSPKIIMTSGFNREREARRGLELGAAAFIGKPYTVEELARVLKDSLSKD